MASYDQHLILHYLDEPLRILYWTVDEALFVIGVPFLGLLVDQTLLGIGTAFVGFFALRYLKQVFGQGTLKHVAYWYLPHNTAQLEHTPPSYIREYVG